MRTIKLLTAAAALVLWMLPGAAGANFPFMEPSTVGSMDVPPIFSLFNQPVADACGDDSKSAARYAYSSYPFSGNTDDSDRTAEKSREKECEKKSCCSEEETERKPDTGDGSDGSGTG